MVCSPFQKIGNFVFVLHTAVLIFRSRGPVRKCKQQPTYAILGNNTWVVCIILKVQLFSTCNYDINHQMFIRLCFGSAFCWLCLQYLIHLCVFVTVMSHGRQLLRSPATLVLLRKFVRPNIKETPTALITGSLLMQQCKKRFHFITSPCIISYFSRLLHWHVEVAWGPFN